MILLFKLVGGETIYIEIQMIVVNDIQSFQSRDLIY
jgi:hypothetical protein